MIGYKGVTHHDDDDKWSWVIFEDGVDIDHGSGYDTQADAIKVMIDKTDDWAADLKNTFLNLYRMTL